jgi:hypothetical protein
MRYALRALNSAGSSTSSALPSVDHRANTRFWLLRSRSRTHECSIEHFGERRAIVSVPLSFVELNKLLDLRFDRVLGLRPRK